MKTLIFILVIGVVTSNALANPPEGAKCLFDMGGQGVHEIPEPVIVYDSSPRVPQDSLIVRRNHAFGTTVHIVAPDGSEIQLKEEDKEGITERVIQLKATGALKLLYQEKNFQREMTIPKELASEIIAQLRSNLQKGGWGIVGASSDVQTKIETVLPKFLYKKNDDKPLAKSFREPVALESLNYFVGIERGHAFGTDRLSFAPHGESLTFEKFDRDYKILETIELKKNGVVTRKSTAREATLTHIISPEVASGIISYAYHYGALGGWNIMSALSKTREFILAEAPQLFLEELHQHDPTSVYVETTDSGIIPMKIDRTPKKYNPDLEFDQ